MHQFNAKTTPADKVSFTNPGNGRRNPDGSLDSGTALPAGLAFGSTFNLVLAR
jgi:hypothetical protein